MHGRNIPAPVARYPERGLADGVAGAVGSVTPVVRGLVQAEPRDVALAVLLDDGVVVAQPSPPMVRSVSR